MSLLVSAPGKILLFGEHAVVHERAALAAALDLRTFLLLSWRATEELCLMCPDVSLGLRFSMGKLPWHLLTSGTIDHAPTSLNAPLYASLEELCSDIGPTQHSTAMAFLYLYMYLGKQTPSTVSIRSELPTGAGLGSSAAMSVCIATALLLRFYHIQSRSDAATIVEAWAFVGEMCIHGNPSGVDNAVATSGGCVLFKRLKGQPAAKTVVRELAPLRLLISDTQHPRKTSNLVQKVGLLLQEFPTVVKPILDSIDQITTNACGLIGTSKAAANTASQMDYTARVNFLGQLIAINHGLLTALGVSHEKLETVRRIADEHGIGWTKLTGAGGGGCAFTLVKESITAEDVEQVEVRLKREGFATFATRLGGGGTAVSEVPSTYDTKQFLKDDIETIAGFHKDYL